jgi:hypothetical protein
MLNIHEKGMAITTPSSYTQRVRKKILKVALVSVLLIQSISPANAGLDAPINLDNPRVVPIYGGNYDAASWSGYLYSSRIIFSAAHSNYKFDSNGNRILNEPAVITVGRPNSSAKDFNGRVRVIKTFVGDYKMSKVGGLNDFIVYVLEKDLVSISNGKLLTVDIEKELVAAQTEVIAHGYGEYRDRCTPEETLPCKKDWNNPNQRTSELPRSPKGSMKLVAPSYFPWLDSDRKEALSNETLLSDNLVCTGDSGGPVTALYKGESIYLGITPNGFSAGYFCGAGTSRTATRPSGYFSPVHKHLDLLKEAEAFVAQQTSTQVKTKVSITCVKGKLIKKVSTVKSKCPAGYKIK